MGCRKTRHLKKFRKTKKYKKRITKKIGAWFPSTIPGSSIIGNKVKAVLSSTPLIISTVLNPASVHRIIFKNYYFLIFLKEDSLKQLYDCSDCLVMHDVSLFDKEIYDTIISPLDKSELAIYKTINNEVEKTNDIHQILDDENKRDINAALEKKDDETSYSVKRLFIDRYEFMKKSALYTYYETSYVKINDAFLTDRDGSNCIAFAQDFLFQYLHIYKYQLSRALWVGGWYDWSFIVNKTRAMLDKNDNVELSNQFRTNFGYLIDTVLDNVPNPFSFHSFYEFKDMIKQAFKKAFSFVKDKTADVKNLVQETMPLDGSLNALIIRKLKKYYDVTLTDTNVSNKFFFSPPSPQFMMREAIIALTICSQASLDLENQNRVNKKEKLQTEYTTYFLASIKNTSSNPNHDVENIDILINKIVDRIKSDTLTLSTVDFILHKCYQSMVKRIIDKMESKKKDCDIANFLFIIMSQTMNSYNAICKSIINRGIKGSLLPIHTPQCYMTKIIKVYIRLCMIKKKRIFSVQDEESYIDEEKLNETLQLYKKTYKLFEELPQRSGMDGEENEEEEETTRPSVSEEI